MIRSLDELINSAEGETLEFKQALSSTQRESEGQLLILDILTRFGSHHQEVPGEGSEDYGG